MSLETITVLGVPVSRATWSELLAFAEERIEQRRPTTIAYANVHVIDTAQRTPALMNFLAQVDLCYCDGNGVRHGARLLGGDIPERMTGADWIWKLAAKAAEMGWRVYWIGGEPGVTEAAAKQLCAKSPTLEIAYDHGFHGRTGTEDDECLARINAFRPDIVLVGMGTPIQEAWVEARRSRIEAPVVWCLGATADFVSGKVGRGPAWLVRHAEWLSRLVHDPGRLGSRYLLGNTRFVLGVLKAARSRPS